MLGYEQRERNAGRGYLHLNRAGNWIIVLAKERIGECIVILVWNNLHFFYFMV